MTCADENQKRLRKALSLLLADDNDSLRETLKLFFAAQGFQVFSAETGIEAVKIARNEDISFSIMDINMPGLSGIEAFRCISEEIKQMPCIFMSGDTSLEVMQNALNVGGFTFIRKPIQIELMRKSVNRLIFKFFKELE